MDLRNTIERLSSAQAQLGSYVDTFERASFSWSEEGSSSSEAKDYSDRAEAVSAHSASIESLVQSLTLTDDLSKLGLSQLTTLYVDVQKVCNSLRDSGMLASITPEEIRHSLSELESELTVALRNKNELVEISDCLVNFSSRLRARGEYQVDLGNNWLEAMVSDEGSRVSNEGLENLAKAERLKVLAVKVAESPTLDSLRLNSDSQLLEVVREISATRGRISWDDLNKPGALNLEQVVNKLLAVVQ